MSATDRRRRRVESRHNRSATQRRQRSGGRRLNLEALEARQLLSASPTLVSTAGFATGNVVGSTIPQDSALLSSGNQETGPLTFTLIAPDNSVVDTETVQVNGDGTYQTSNTNVAAQVGTYSWQASYAGDSQNNPASDQGGPAEQVTVVKASPTLVSTATFTGGNVVGSAIPEDSVVLSRGFQESGLLTFTLTAPNNGIVDTETVTPNGDGTYATSNATVATEVGTYTWTVSYAGDGFNNSANDQGGTAEQLSTIKASPTITTSASETAGGVVGSAVLSDSVTVAGGDNPTGAVTFMLTAPDGTTSTVGAVAVTGDNTYNSPTVIATEVGTYSWHASYGGDGLNNSAVDNGVNESLTTINASPSIATSASETASGVVGTAVLSDSVTVSGGDSPTGTVTFTLTRPDGTVISAGSVSINGGGTYSDGTTVVATQVGTYTWHANYSGDGLNNGAADNGINESVTTIKASPSIATSASETAGGVVGSAVLSDSVTVSGGDNPTGTVTFTVTRPDGSVISAGSVSINGDGNYSNGTTVLATQVGTYTWHASYGGDSLNNGAVDNGVNESLSTIKANPSITTSASETAGGVVGTAVLSDSVTISGGDSPTGTVTFTLTAPDGTTSTVGAVTVAGDNTYNAPTVLATEVGTYTWHAAYGGDSLNNGAADNGVNESVTTIKASPTISTSASETLGGVVGSAVLSDSVTVSGGDNPTGAVTFSLTRPDGSVVPAGSVSINGDGTYSNGTTVLATQVGVYTWHASYGGDGLNNGASDNGTNESLTTIKASPTLVTTASFKSGTGNIVGTAVPEDSAVLSGGYQESGKITFKLTAPDGTVADTETVTPNGDGTYSTLNTAVATQGGVYTWSVSYAGDGLNNAAHDQGGTAEKLATFQPGTWQTLAPTNPSAGPSSTLGVNLLSDGTVMVESGGSQDQNWYKLTPSASGSYVNGTWSPFAPMNLQRLYFSTAVLPDGRLIAVGGEYYGPSNTKFTNTCEMYDPVHNTWTYIASAPSPTGTLGECPVEVLPDGRVLASDKRGPATSVYNPATNTWIAAPNKLLSDWTDEETWVKLPDNSILCYDIWASITNNTFQAQRYIPDANGGPGTWVDASNVDPTNPPSLLSNPGADWEIGPGFLQADGRVIQFGALGNTAIYNPATNAWSAGPAEPSRLINGVSQQLVMTDQSGATLPDGNILLLFSPMNTSIGGLFAYEYNPVTQTYADVTPSGSIGAKNMMILPTGQVLIGWGGAMQVYTPAGTALTAVAPDH